MESRSGHSTITPFRPKLRTQATAAEDATLEFAAESDAVAVPPDPPTRRRWVGLTAALMLLAVAGVAGWTWRGQLPTSATGSVVIHSDPEGADVLIDGRIYGTTPVELSLPAGHHLLDLQLGSETRQVAVDVASAREQTLHVAWAAPGGAGLPSGTGSLTVTSDTPGVDVSIDGARAGSTPLTVEDVAAGEHEVVVQVRGGQSRRRVEVAPGSAASLHVADTPLERWGWLSISAPFEVRVLEGGRVIGTSGVEQIRLPPGDHDLELVSEPFGFQQRLRARITAGRPLLVTPDVPQVALSVTASPWAEVMIDGISVGDTPLSNVTLPLGDHLIVFRHPVLGERRQFLRVTRLGPRVLSVDMTAP